MTHIRLLACLATAVALSSCDKTSTPSPPQSSPPNATALGMRKPNADGSVTIGLATDSIFQSKTVWENQDGLSTPLAKLGGRPLIVALVFTQCQASCPIIMADLKAIEAELTIEELSNIRFAVFSIDAARETATTLRTFASDHHVDLKHWAFYHGDAAAVRELAAMLHVRFAELPNGGFDHANIITIVDSAGVQRFQQSGLGLSPREIVTHLRLLFTPAATP